MSQAAITIQIYVKGDVEVIVDMVDCLKHDIAYLLKRYPITHEGVHIEVNNTFGKTL